MFTNYYFTLRFLKFIHISRIICEKYIILYKTSEATVSKIFFRATEINSYFLHFLAKTEDSGDLALILLPLYLAVPKFVHVNKVRTNYTRQEILKSFIHIIEVCLENC